MISRFDHEQVVFEIYQSILAGVNCGVFISGNYVYIMRRTLMHSTANVCITSICYEGLFDIVVEKNLSDGKRNRIINKVLLDIKRVCDCSVDQVYPIDLSLFKDLVIKYAKPYLDELEKPVSSENKKDLSSSLSNFLKSRVN